MANKRYKYEADSGDIHPIRMSEFNLTAVNTEPAGVINNSVRVQVSKGRTEFGLGPRGLRLYREVGVSPNTFNRYKFLPILTETAFDNAAFNEGATVTINSVAWTVGSRVPQSPVQAEEV